MSFRKTIAMFVTLFALLLVTGCSGFPEQEIITKDSAPAVRHTEEVTPALTSSSLFAVDGETYFYVLTSEQLVELRFQLTEVQYAAYRAAGNELFSEVTEEMARSINNGAVDAVLTVAGHHHPGDPKVIYTVHPGKPGINIP